MNNDYNKWDRRFLDLATLVASWSKDTTKCGAVVVDSLGGVRGVGYNGFPRGVHDAIERNERPAKYSWTEHSERNCLYNMLRAGISADKCSMYISTIPSGLLSCCDCARAIIQAGITKVVQYEPEDTEASKRWNESTSTGQTMFQEAGVELIFIEPKALELKEASLEAVLMDDFGLDINDTDWDMLACKHGVLNWCQACNENGPCKHNKIGPCKECMLGL